MGPKEILDLKKFWAPKILGPKKFWVQKGFVGVKKLGQKFFLDQNKILGPKFFVKAGAVLTEILLKWTNVTSIYVTCTNVTILTGIC